MASDHAPGFKDHFSARAADYARHRPHYPAALADYLAGLAPTRGLALDCGCGAGQLSTLLGDRFAQVLATDASPQQIAHAAPHPHVRYEVRPAESSGLPAASVDLVTVAQAAHWLDLDAFYAEVRRVLRPGGVVALITYGLIEIDGPPGAVVAGFYRRLAPHWPPERRHVESGYQALPFPFTPLAPPRLVMEARWPLAAVLGYVDTWSAVRALEKAEGRKPFEDFAIALTDAWKASSGNTADRNTPADGNTPEVPCDPEPMMTVRWPLALRVGRPP